ncbi:MAG: flagellar biosynthesis protein FlhF [Spirochaetes bacterium]|nr:flagellar biosynthesis protein FlhF [Spirochaetota bacterium]
MIYRTFKAPTYKEAVLKAKIEMGSNVYIIGRKAIKEGGFLGMFAKNFSEITVAKNEDDNNKVKNTASGGMASQPRNVFNQAENDKKWYESGILKELSEIKNRLKEITDVKNVETDSSHFDKLIAVLLANDFPQDYINQLRDEFENELTVKESHDPKVLEEKFREHILKSIETSGPIQLGNGRPSVVVLVGPTGVGKTTTIAKLAASFGVLQKHKVELLTIDSYRIAAIEQLGKYAELMQLPFTIINTREEFKSAVKNSKSDLIFVDTAGRSQKNNLGLAELRSILDGINSNLDIHLVLSATTKYRDALDIMTRFNQLMYNKIIITKIDETNTIGSLLSIMNREKKLSYITTGQSVPDDIELAGKEKLLDMILFEDFYAG